MQLKNNREGYLVGEGVRECTKCKTLYERTSNTVTLCNKCNSERVKAASLESKIMRDLIFPEEDGVTHVNVYSKGKTELGRFLSNFAHTPFKCRDGKFQSVEGYWHWLKTGDNRLRKLYGYLAKKRGKELERPMVGHNALQFVPDFRERIEDAVIAKLEANPEKKEELAALELPLEHYYVCGDKVVHLKDDWFIELLRDIHDALKEDS